mmetsp:Transcript_11882/g.21986  ORF Transcript_11882/g.21986 Transcript_11882/m.21986 type:complete len:110 (+) Transcript_11882:105-434(+)
MMYKKLLAVMFLSLSTDTFVSASTRPATKKSLSRGTRIQQEQQAGPAFFRISQDEDNTRSTKPVAPLSGWVKDFSGAVKEDFVSARSCKKEEIIHDCVVNYSWGLVGNF